MPVEFLPIVVLIVLATGFAFLVVGIGHLFGPHSPNPRKGSPYESGMRPYGSGQRRFRVSFYLIAVLFILFDVEIIFLLPWAVVLDELKLFGLIEMVVFILVLLVGYVYAWKRGALEWE